LLGEKAEGKAELVLDVWFPEAYWKIGTLHLDRREYRQGAFEICRFLAIEKHLPSRHHERESLHLYAQAPQYLTEARFHLKEFRSARYYADRTLELDPENRYALEILRRMDFR